MVRVVTEPTATPSLRPQRGTFDGCWMRLDEPLDIHSLKTPIPGPLGEAVSGMKI